MGWIGGGVVAAHAYRLVDFFFVLSGFVISHAFRDTLQRGGIALFLSRRFFRLWPLHLATLAAVVVMAAAGGLVGLSIHGWTWPSLPAALTLTQSWGYLDRNVWNGPSWSISTEVFSYLTFAVLAWRLPPRLLDGACTLVLLASLAVLIWVAPDGFLSTHDFGIARCLAGFMAGALAETLWRRGARFRGELAALVIAAGVILFMPISFDPLLLPLFAWFVLVFAADAGPVSRLLGRGLPQMLGTVSYSIYMVHYPLGVEMMAALMMLTDWVVEIEGRATVVASLWSATASASRISSSPSLSRS